MLSGSLVHSTALIDKDKSCCPGLQHDSANIEDRIHAALDAHDVALLHEHHPAFPSFPKDPKLRRPWEKSKTRRTHAPTTLEQHRNDLAIRHARVPFRQVWYPQPSLMRLVLADTPRLASILQMQLCVEESYHRLLLLFECLILLGVSRTPSTATLHNSTRA